MKWQRQWFRMIGLVLIVAFLTAGAWMIVSVVLPTAAPLAPQSTADPSVTFSPSPDSPGPMDSPGATEAPTPSPTVVNPLEGGWLNWFKELFTRLN